jgi:hypothetical protein
MPSKNIKKQRAACPDLSGSIAKQRQSPQRS